MAKAKNTTEEIENIKENDETTAELEEVREAEPAVDLPGEAVTETVAVETDDADDTDDAPEGETEDQKTERLTKAGKHSGKAVREAEAEAARQEAKEHRAEDEAHEEIKAPKRQLPNPLHQHGKKYRAAAEKVEKGKFYDLSEALKLAADTATTKFDSSVELHVNLGVDPRQADQMVRATVVLPNGTGKTIRIAVFAEGKVAEDAKTAGADVVGSADLLSDIEAGKLDFDMLIATPAGMATLGKVAKILGPRGLMPNPKSGTVTPDPAKAIAEAKAGKVEFRIDKQAIVHQAIGKVSFDAAKLEENARTFLTAIMKAKPSAAKGTYVKAITVTSSMGPAIKVDSSGTISVISGNRK